jgi:UDPglucose 6-dehydrogenase
VIKTLIDKGAIVSTYDPMACDNMRNIFGDIAYYSSTVQALENTDACLIMTEWEEFKDLCSEFKVMHRPIYSISLQ